MGVTIRRVLIWKCLMKILMLHLSFRVRYSISLPFRSLLIKFILCLGKSTDDSQASHQDSLLGQPPNMFQSPDAAKRQNPFRSNQDSLHQMQQPQMLLHPHMPMPRSAPRPLLDIPNNFNNNPYIHNPLGTDIEAGNNHNPFALTSPRGLNPHVNQTHSPQMNYRNNNPIRGNSPYFRGQNKGSPMRGSGGYRPNFRGGMRGNW